MSQLRRSPERGQFNIDCELKRVEEGEKTIEEALEMIKFHKSWQEKDIERENSEEFKQDNLEYDLRTSDYIVEKCKIDYYAQNLYAALCNNDFIKNETWNILQEKTWSCSWRYAGGIIAHIQQKGDYIDWYCSGIQNELSDEEYNQLTKVQQEQYLYTKTKYVGEGYVTDEIREDLLKIGWIVKGEK
jgi:hypothetical protein